MTTDKRWEPVPNGFFQSSIHTGLYAVSIKDDFLSLHIMRLGDWHSLGVVVLPDNLRLCRLVEDEPQPLDMPDGPGWWAYESSKEWRYPVEITKWEIKDDVVTVRYAHAPSQTDDIVEHVAEFLRKSSGKWYRLTMPWDEKGS